MALHYRTQLSNIYFFQLCFLIMQIKTRLERTLFAFLWNIDGVGFFWDLNSTKGKKLFKYSIKAIFFPFINTAVTTSRSAFSNAYTKWSEITRGSSIHKQKQYAVPERQWIIKVGFPKKNMTYYFLNKGTSFNGVI